MSSLQIEKLDLDDHALKFCTPCAISITGSSQSGKSYLMAQLVEHRTDLFNTHLNVKLPISKFKFISFSSLVNMLA